MIVIASHARKIERLFVSLSVMKWGENFPKNSRIKPMNFRDQASTILPKRWNNFPLSHRMGEGRGEGEGKGEIFDVRRSMFDVRCSTFDVPGFRASIFSTKQFQSPKPKVQSPAAAPHCANFGPWTLDFGLFIFMTVCSGVFRDPAENSFPSRFGK